MKAHLNVDESLLAEARAGKRNASAFELLAVLIVGGVGMFLSELGIEVNSPVIHWAGIITSISAAGWITVRFIRELIELINYFKKK